MINEELLKKQLAQAEKATGTLVDTQKILNSMLSGVMKDARATNPEAAKKIKNVISLSAQIMEQAKAGDIGKIDELVKKLKNEK